MTGEAAVVRMNVPNARPTLTLYLELSIELCLETRIRPLTGSGYPEPVKGRFTRNAGAAISRRTVINHAY
jgi:hypothetical protein